MMTTTKQSTVKNTVARIKIAIDMHKNNYRVVRQQDYTLPEPAQKFTPPAFMAWLKKQLTLAGEVIVCYEAGCFGYEPARRMAALGARVLVVAPQNWDEAGKKQVNDKFDARVMCQRLSNYLDGHRHALSIVRIPTRAQEEHRALARQRDQVRKLQRQTQAMGRSLLLRCEFFAVRGRWWRGETWQRLQEELAAPAVEQLRRYVALLELCEEQARELEAELTKPPPPPVEAATAATATTATTAATATTATTATPATLSTAGCIPELFFGEGALSHELIHRELFDWHRFHNPRQVGNYFGLCPSESTSDERRRLGSITKHGNPRLRRLLVELAWRVVFYQPTYRGLQKWRAVFAGPKSQSAARKKAIVALARQLATDLWRLATGRRTLAELGLTCKGAQPAPSAA